MSDGQVDHTDHHSDHHGDHHSIPPGDHHLENQHLREALNGKVLDFIGELASLRAEVKELGEKLDQILPLVQDHDRKITTLRTIWTLVSGLVGFTAAFLKDFFMRE